mgnify:CR=1 FL=1
MAEFNANDAHLYARVGARHDLNVGFDSAEQDKFEKATIAEASETKVTLTVTITGATEGNLIFTPVNGGDPIIAKVTESTGNGTASAANLVVGTIYDINLDGYNLDVNQITPQAKDSALALKATAKISVQNDDTQEVLDENSIQEIGRASCRERV